MSIDDDLLRERRLGRAASVATGLALLALGIALLAVPVAIGLSFDRRQFITEGSPAGTIAFVVAGALALGGLVGGLVCAFAGMTRLALGLGSKFGTAIVVLALLPFLVLATAKIARENLLGAPPDTSSASSTGGRTVTRSGTGDAYHFAWGKRSGAPELALSVPALFIPRGTTLAGDPDRVTLALAAQGATAELTLYRDDATAAADGWTLPASRGFDAAWIWVVKRPHWRMLGIDCRKSRTPLRETPANGAGPVAGCHVPESRLAAYVPMFYGLERGRLHADGDAAGCRLSFAFNGRTVGMRGADPCWSHANLVLLRNGANVLHNMARHAGSG